MFGQPSASIPTNSYPAPTWIVGLFVGAFLPMPGFLSLALRAKRLRCVPARPGERGSVVRILFHAAFSSLELHAVRCQTLVNFWREKDDTTWTPFTFVVFNLSSDG